MQEFLEEIQIIAEEVAKRSKQIIERLNASKPVIWIENNPGN